MAVLKKKVKDKWVRALRSGKYQQGRNALNESGRYCCLGVLCEVAVKGGLDIERREHGGYVSYGGNSSYPPFEVSGWAKLKKAGEVDPFHTSRGSLTALNDIQGLTFAEIADIIEKEL